LLAHPKPSNATRSNMSIFGWLGPRVKGFLCGAHIALRNATCAGGRSGTKTRTSRGLLSGKPNYAAERASPSQAARCGARSCEPLSRRAILAGLGLSFVLTPPGDASAR
jgi:hypothetical protein